MSIVTARDIYLASYGSVNGVGGGHTVTEQLAAALAERDCGSLILGVGEQAGGACSHDAEIGRLNLPSDVPRCLWRFRNWLVPRTLASPLSKLPPPGNAFVGLNPLWILAARRAWPDVPVIYLFVALLSNCQPFTWRRQRGTFQQRLDHAAVRRAELRALSQADRVIVPTHQAREELLAFTPGFRTEIEVCNYGVEPREADQDGRVRRRTELGLDKGDFLTLAVGVCNPNKAFDLAISEMRMVDRNGHLAIIGDGPETERLRELVKQLDLSDRVHLVGRQAELDSWYAAADCGLSTSHYDTFPYVILDGMSSGRPVVVPRHDPPRVFAGLAEIVSEHGGGLLYDRSRPGALAVRLNQLIRDTEMRVLLGKKARDIARRRITWQACVDLILGKPEKQYDALQGRRLASSSHLS